MSSVIAINRFIWHLVGPEITRRLRSRSVEGIRLLMSIHGVERAANDALAGRNRKGREK